MSVLIYAESNEGKFKKTTFELASYAKKIAESLGTTVTAVTINTDNESDLGKYGVDKVLKVNQPQLDKFNAKAYADVIKQAAEKENANIVVLTSTTNSLYAAPIVAVNLNAGYASNVVALPVSTSPFQVKKKCFFKQRFQHYRIDFGCKSFGFSEKLFRIDRSYRSCNSRRFRPNFERC